MNVLVGDGRRPQPGVLHMNCHCANGGNAATCDHVAIESQPDFIVAGGGTVYTLTPRTPQAEEWLNEHIGDDAHYLGRGLVVEHRYIRDIVEGAIADGFTVR